MKHSFLKLLGFTILTFSNLGISKFASAQVPQKFNYQGIARDTKGNPLAQQKMSLKISVLPTSDATIPEYEEIQTVTTNEFGLYTLQIGAGNVMTGEMKAVKWETGNKYINVAIDPKGGNDFIDAGTNQLLSVPYAIYADKAGVAKNSGSSSRATNNFIEKTNGSGVVNSTSQIYDNGTNIGIGTTSPVARVHVNTANAGVQEHIRMQNTSNTGAGRFTLYNSNANAFATFTKYGTNYAGGYTGISSQYPYANLLAFGNNDTNGAGNGRFLISTEGNTGISIFKSGTSKLKYHIDYSTERVGIGGNAIPQSNVHFNNTDGTGDTLKLTNNSSGHTASDGLELIIGGTAARIVNKENDSLTLGTNNLTRMKITSSGTTEFNGQVKIAGGSPAAGKVLTSDATGLATWQVPSSSLWVANGTNMYNSNTGKIGIGTGASTPSAKLHVVSGLDTVGYFKSSGTKEYSNGILRVDYASTNDSIAENKNPVAIYGKSSKLFTVIDSVDYFGQMIPYYNPEPRGTGVFGFGGYTGVFGLADSTLVIPDTTVNPYDNGVRGVGVIGKSKYGAGVRGISYDNFGIDGFSNIGIGVRGVSNDQYGMDALSQYSRGISASGSTQGLYAYSYSGVGIEAQSVDSTAIVANSVNNTAIFSKGNIAGVKAEGGQIGIQGHIYSQLVGATDIKGIDGYSHSTSANYSDGVHGYARNTNYNNCNSRGIVGVADSGWNNFGGLFLCTNGRIWSGGGANYGLWTDARAGGSIGNVNYSGVFNNGIVLVQGTGAQLNCSGSMSKASGTFKIDHPLDPENKYLYHSFVESPDMMNIYNGVITTDNTGRAEVKLPSYFEALNFEFRYQLTVIDQTQFAQVRISKEISNNKFSIQSDKPNIKVSWQVTGVRNDKYAQAHRIIDEVEKPKQYKGTYIHPEEWGQTNEKAEYFEEYSKIAKSYPKAQGFNEDEINQRQRREIEIQKNIQKEELKRKKVFGLK